MMADDSAPAPAYGDPPLPPYTDGPDPVAPPTDTKSPIPAPAPAPVSPKLWFQSTDISGLYRRRLILPAHPLHDGLSDPYGASSSSTPPPNYADSRTTPLYTMRNHSVHSSASPRGSLSAKTLRQPDFTIYAGEGDEGPVVATGMFHNKKLQRGIGEIRFFPRSSSGVGGSSSVPGETPSILVKESGNKYILEVDGQRLEWAETGPGEQREEVPPAPAPPSPTPALASPHPPTSPGLFGKFKKLVSSAPRVPPTSLPPKKTVTLCLSRHDPTTTTGPGGGAGVVVATYTELQPLGTAEFLYRAVPPTYKDGHCGSLEIQEPGYMFVGGAGADAARDLAVVSLSLLLEYERRETLKNKNRSWGSMPAVSGGGGFGG